MKIISSIILFIAVFLDGIFSNITLPYLNSNFTIITLLLIYPLFFHHKTIYLLLLFSSTICYDILYTNVLFLNTTILFCMYLLIDKAYKRVDFYYIFASFLLYELLIFSCFYTIGYVKSINFFFEIILNSTIINIIYSIFLYLLLKKHYRKGHKLNYS